MLKIYNSLTREKQAFHPIIPGQIRMYVCGMTVYDFCHIGHARVLVVFDTVVRYLRSRGFKVAYVRNITDVDDKIIQRAAELKEPIETLTARFIKAMHQDARALGVQAPDVEPRATESMDEILVMIQTLVDKGYAYVASNGDVFYDVSRFNDYGRLSGKDIEDLRVGARVEVNEAKDDPLDFALWKAAKPGDPSWDSPWGPGRPGWHIECSAMSTAHLGAHFDIHGGGMDLQFPHHENEIAQSEACTGEHFVNVWMHNGFVRVNEEKMSKSLGNFFTVREVLKRYKPEEVRYFILDSHYRSPLNYSDDQLDNARSALTRLYTALRGLPRAQLVQDDDYKVRFNAAMDDDFNTAEALAVLFALARDINRMRVKDPSHAAVLGAQLKQLGKILGLLQDDPDAYLKSPIKVSVTAHAAELHLKGQRAEVIVEDITEEQIEKLIVERNKARLSKEWAKADKIRDQLKAQGIILEDNAAVTTWRREQH